MRYSLKRLFVILLLAALFSYIIAALTTWAHPDRRLELIPAVDGPDTHRDFESATKPSK